MALIPNEIRKKIENLLGQTGVIGDEQIVMQNISMTGVPQDDFLTEVYIRRAKLEAESLPENYRCFGCGKTYDDQNEFLACMQDHVKDFMAGIPIERLPEFEKEKLDQLPPEIRNSVEQMRRDGILPNDSPTGQE